MSQTTSDPGTPIFGELNSELELPEIDVHDFEELHAFRFPEEATLAAQDAQADAATNTSSETAGKGSSGDADSTGTEQAGTEQTGSTQNGSTSATAGQAESGSRSAESSSGASKAVHAAGEAKPAAGTKRGGRRRKEE